MPSEKISNEMIYELLKAQGHRLNEQSRRLDDLHDQSKDLKSEIKDVKSEQRDSGKRLRSLEDKIDHIRISWSTRLISSILATSAVTSAIVAYVATSIL